MSGFFGFDSALPERRDAPFQDFTNPIDGAGAEEDLAVYTWGEEGYDGLGNALLEGGDDLNDETFGDDMGPVGNDFQYSQQPVQQQSYSRQPQSFNHNSFIPQSNKPNKAPVDLFASSEADFFSKPKRAPKARPTPQQTHSVESLWNKQPQGQQQQQQQQHQQQQQQYQPSSNWGSAPPKTLQEIEAEAMARSQPPRNILSMEEIEAEMARVAAQQQPPQQPRAPQQQSRGQGQFKTLAEIEREMMTSASPAPAPASAPVAAPASASAAVAAPSTQAPAPPSAGPNVQAQQQALLDRMFPALGSAPLPGQTPRFPEGHPSPSPPVDTRSPEEIARAERKLEIRNAKIQAMSKYNNIMLSGDKDFITRIQLSQLATSDPYITDFYAQVYSALMRSKAAAAAGQGSGPSVIQVAPGIGMGVGVGGQYSTAGGNRFGKLGTGAMQKLSTQVKRLVEGKKNRQENSGSTEGLARALGRVHSRTTQAAPRAVLQVPTSAAKAPAQARPSSPFSQQTTIRQPLTKKQVMYALEELYDLVLEAEQLRRQAPPPGAQAEFEDWNAKCQQKSDLIWTRLMILEPLDISDPHPFISLLSPLKGQRLFPRVIRHLSGQQSMTLLTLLVATYAQLDVVIRAPPPPAADASLLTKADRLDRAKREAETENFLHCVVPVVDTLIGRCGLGLVSGLLGICVQRMEVARVASTRPGVALFTTLLSRAQILLHAPAGAPAPEMGEQEQWATSYLSFLHALLPHLPNIFPSSQAQRAAFGPSAYLLGGDGTAPGAVGDREGFEIERREAEVWGLAAALAVNAPEEEQMNLVGSLRDKIIYTVQAARNAATPPPRAELKLRNVNMFLNGLGLDASLLDA